MFDLSGIKVPEIEIDKLFPNASRVLSRNGTSQPRSRTVVVEAKKESSPLKSSHLVNREDIPVGFEDFKQAILSKETNSRFRTVMKRIRIQAQQEDTKAEVLKNLDRSHATYLPTDLSKMLSHLFQRSLHTQVSKELFTNIKEEKVSTLHQILTNQEAIRNVETKVSPSENFKITEAEQKKLWKEKIQNLITQRVKDNTEGFISLFDSEGQ